MQTWLEGKIEMASLIYNIFADIVKKISSMWPLCLSLTLNN